MARSYSKLKPSLTLPFKKDDQLKVQSLNSETRPGCLRSTDADVAGRPILGNNVNGNLGLLSVSNLNYSATFNLYI